MKGAEDNYQLNYQKLLTFLSRKGQRGYIFARADDYRLIRVINNSLLTDLTNKRIRTELLFLDPKSDVPLVAQIEMAFENAKALIVANLYQIVNDEQNGLDNLIHLNFAREAFWEFNRPILFWADAQSMNVIANKAIDLFSQRRHGTTHFETVAVADISDLQKRKELEPFLSSERFEQIQTDISILERRLTDAKDTAYHHERIAAEIALPLAKHYAELDLSEKAKDILEHQSSHFDLKDHRLLADLAQVYYLLHDYEKAIETLEQANLQIENRYSIGAYPQQWFVNLSNLANWQIELGHPEKVLERLLNADKALGYNSVNEEILKFNAVLIKDSLAQIMMMSGELQNARKYFQEILLILERLIKNNPRSEQLQRNLAVGYEKIGYLEQMLGELQSAEKNLRLGLSIREKLSLNNPLSEEFQRDLSISYNTLGEIEQELGNIQNARKYFLDAFLIVKKLSQINPLSEKLQRDVSISYNNLGDIEQALGDIQSALKYFRNACFITEKLSQKNPFSEKLQVDLSLSYDNLGEIEQELGELQNARSYFQNSLQITEKLIRNNPFSEQLQGDLARSYISLGDIELAIGELQNARKYFHESLLIRENLNKNRPATEPSQRALFVSYNRLGNVNKALHDLENARKYGLKALSLAKNLIKNNPFAEKSQRELSISYHNLGEIAQELGELQEAEKYFKDSLLITKKLSENNPDSEQLQRDIAAGYSGLASVTQDINSAIDYLAQSVDIINQLIAKNPLSKPLKDDVVYYQQEINERTSKLDPV